MLLNKIRKKMNNRGFSLVEVLIAVSILAIIAVPMAMNMISSSQINGQSKQISSSSDISTSVLDVLQTVPLSDIMTEMNGYTTDSYGADLPYLMTADALATYKIGGTMEVLKKENADGTYYYQPVVKQEEAATDAGVTASVKTRTTGEVVRTYFSGTDNDEYSFILKDVETDQMQLDVLTTIKPIKPDNENQAFDMVNINSMNQSEVKFASQQDGVNEVVANEFLRSNQKYINKMISIGKTAEQKTYDWFIDNMERTIIIKIVQDAHFDTVTITIDATYTVDPKSENGELFMHESDATYVENIDAFTTNSTSEFARGIYLYFYPLTANIFTGEIRDHFIIENNQNLAVPVFLIAKSDDKNVDPTNIEGHKLSIELRESASADGSIRTTICSNIPDPDEFSRWTKNNPNLKIQSMGNRTEQQIIYEATVSVFTHRDTMFDESTGNFTPNEKYLLVENVGSFLDTSEKRDIESDKTTIERPDNGRATIIINPLHIYDGHPYKGVDGQNVSITGNVQTNAGKYVAYVTPLEGFTWEDGSNNERIVDWEILRSPTAGVVTIDRIYNGEVQSGIYSRSDASVVTITGQTEGKDAGKYIIRAVPTDNYCWPDSVGTDQNFEIREFEWTISPRTVNVVWYTGEGFDWWKYDGDVHYGSCYFPESTGGQSGVIPGDSCEPMLRNHDIKNVGEKFAEVYDLTNKNYKLTTTTVQLTHKIQVLDDNTAGYGLVNGGVLDYNTKIQDVIEFQQGVWFEGPTKEKDSGVYEIIVHVKDGYAWPDGSREPKPDTWRINPHATKVEWGVHEWVFDGIVHKTTCVPTDILENDSCVVNLDENNWILDVGTKTTKIVSLSNPNYVLDVDAITEMELKVTPSNLSYYSTLDVVYDGRQHKGVFGQYIIIEEKIGGEWKDVTATYKKSEVNQNASQELIPYEVRVSPRPNYTWADGTTDKITVVWYIFPTPIAEYQCRDMTYTGKEQQGVFYTDATHTGTIKATEIGTYNATVTPNKNLAWYVNELAKDYEACNYTSRTEHLNNGHTPMGCMHDLTIYDMKTKNVQWNIFGVIVPIPQFEAYDPKTGYIELEYNSQYIGPVRKGHSANDRYPTTSNSASTSQTLDADYYTLSGDIRRRNVKDRNGDSVGYYTMTATLKDKIRYTWADGTIDDKVYKWRIHPYRVGVGSHNETFTYNGKTQTATIAITNVFPDDVGKVDFTYQNNTRIHYGSHQYNITGLTRSEKNNYSINKTYFKTALTTEQKTGTITINKLGAIIDWTPSSKEKGGEPNFYWIFDGGTKTATAEITNKQKTDSGNTERVDPVYTQKYVKEVDDGKQTMTITDIKNGPNLQYNDYKIVADATRTIRIEPLTVQLKWGGAYPSTTYNGSEQTVTCHVNNPVSGFPVAPTLSGHKYKNAGTYTATATKLSDSNYTLSGSNSSVQWTIKPAKLTVNWSPKQTNQKVYDGKTITLTATFSGLKGGDNPSPNYSGTRSLTNVGSVSVTVSSCSSSNYTVTPSTATIKITPAAATPPKQKNRTYNGSAQNGYEGGSHCSMSGDYRATNAGTYSWTANAHPNYAFPGGKTSWTVAWIMSRSNTAVFSAHTTIAYQAGRSASAIIVAKHVNLSGNWTARQIGDSGTVTAVPESNYAWSNGTTGSKSVSWSMH